MEIRELCTRSLLGLLAVLVACGSVSESPLPSGVRGDRLLVEKAAHRMGLFRGDSLLKVYRVALSRAPVGDKMQEGDNRVPEGVYRIDRRLEHSRFHRALHVSYPDSAHATRAHALGLAPGGDVMVHGIKNGLGWVGAWQRRLDWTKGCIAVTNAEIDELWRAVPDGAIIEIRP
ncbi:MAG: L,D-transpeptidase family protein [Gemmatimonadota bacterium]|nr:L,D-transpeptidase family protein [Gemmatimonadota bacterium]